MPFLNTKVYKYILIATSFLFRALAFYVLAILFVLNFSATAQNLVLNPSFEVYSSCPNSGQVNGYINHWFAFTEETHLQNQSYNACSFPSFQVPNNGLAFQYAHTGVGYGRVRVFTWEEDYDTKEYLEGTLSSRLVKNRAYCVSYWINLPERTRGAVKNVDAHLSDTLLDWNATEGPVNILTGIKPHITCDTLMQDTANWYQVKGLYKARGGEKYITIGNFLKREETTFLLLDPLGVSVSYFIDDVSVIPLGLQVPNLGPDTTLCSGNFPYQLQAPAGYDSYLWSTGATTATLNVTTPGTYWLRCATSDCGFITDSVVISSQSVPGLSLGNDTTLCKGASLTLAAQNGFSAYSWSTGHTGQTISVTAAGTYSVIAHHSCGARQAYITVQLDSVPDIPLGLGPDTTLCDDGHNHTLTLTASAHLPNYHWNTGQTTQSITVTREGAYTVQSLFACGTLTDTIHISECPPFFFAPNVFTPNGDGINDVWQPGGKNIIIEEIAIFNRWGGQVYKARAGWPGNNNIGDFAEGVYFYHVRYRDLDGSIYTDKGTISLLR